MYTVSFVSCVGEGVWTEVTQGEQRFGFLDERLFVTGVSRRVSTTAECLLLNKSFFVKER